MKSIENQLSKRLLIGQGVLWVIASLAIWNTSRAFLFLEFDSELRAIGSALRFHLRDTDIDEEVESRWPGFLSKEHGGSFQAWNQDGSVRVRSENPGTADLPRPFEPAALETMVTPELPRVSFEMRNFEGLNGSRIRGVVVISRSPGLRFGSDRKIRTTVLLVARNRGELDRKLIFLGLGVFAAGILASWITAVFARRSVRHGLSPVIEMGEKAALIDVRNLETRFDEDGDVAAELQPISRAFNGLLQRLEDGFIRERRFSADAAHELRTPVAEMKSVAELIAKWPEEATENRNNQILSAAKQMERILDSLMDLAQWEAENEKVAVTQVDVKSVIVKAWEQNAPLAQKKKLKLEPKVETSTRSISTNPTLFQLIISNLIENAVAYCKAGTSIQVESLPTNSGAFLTISNEVENFDPKSVPHLTERFWRADGARTSEKHSGLGLSIVAACADRLGWSFEIEFAEIDSILHANLRIPNPAS